MTILDNIIRDQKILVAERKQLISIDGLMKQDKFTRPTYSLKQNILNNNVPAVIAEFKRRSPSKPDININADITTVPLGYEKGGAAALSILTNEKYFMGSDQDIIETRPRVNIPILRKEFIIDEYQLYEAKAMGADLVLLIAEALTKVEALALAKKAKSLNLEVLMELHDEDEITKLNDEIDFVGVNNRNLKNFVTTIQTSIDIFDKLPKDMIKVSESGIHSYEEVITLFNHGYKAFLIGENFMKNNDPGASCAKFMQDIKSNLR
jgi:indole-3-glycerol phosphate synthase